MGSNSFLGRSRPKAGSSVGSEKDLNARLRRTKIRRPLKLSEYGSKRIPDYTELAYKEAVAKLRYFLSGNYSPSVRSYGGSASIKNLDESDGDIDKKYTPYTLDKPRPRLTAKYTTLYADSLKNYTPPSGVGKASSPAAPATPAADASPDVVQFIQKQEEYIEQLERESQYCREELNSLLGKVKDVISENEQLQDQQKERLISRMLYPSETDDVDDGGDSGDSDHKAVAPRARKPAPRRLEGPSIVFESRISELEAQLAQANIDLRKVQEENNENKRRLAAGLGDSACLDGFKRQIENLQRDKSALEAQVTKLRDAAAAETSSRGDGRDDRGREERLRLETELRRLREELACERAKCRELAGETARRAGSERAAAEARYRRHCDELSRDLSAEHDAVAKLQMELERQRRDEGDLKREISMKNAAIDDLKNELKNKTASLQADLAAALAERAAAAEEAHAARLALERLQRHARHEANRLNSEIQALRQRLDRADADLVHSRRECLRLADQVAAAERDLTMKTLTPMSPEKSKRDKEISSALESIENKHARTVAELESMIQSQNSLMEKLTGECRSLTDKLDDANRRHKEELATLHHQVDFLGRSLQVGTADTSYSAQPTYTNTTNGTGQYNPTDARPVHSGPDTARQPQASRRPSVANTGDHRQTRNNSRIVSRQSSRTSVRQESPTNPGLIAATPKQEIDNVNFSNTAPVATVETANPTNYEALSYSQNQENYNTQNNYEEQKAAELETDTKAGTTEHDNRILQETNVAFEPNQPSYVQNQLDQQNFDQNQTNYNQDPITNQTNQNYNQGQPQSENNLAQNQVQYDQTDANYETNQAYDPNAYDQGNYDPSYQNYDANTYEQGYAYEPNNTYQEQYDPNTNSQTYDAQNIPADQNTELNMTPQSLERDSPVKTELKS